MKKVKRFVVFCWHDYEAYGGWGDFAGDFSYKKRAIEFAKEKVNEKFRVCWDFAQIVDLNTGIVLELERG